MYDCSQIDRMQHMCVAELENHWIIAFAKIMNY